MIRWVSENFTLKLVSLAASIVIWFYATSTERNPVPFTKQVAGEVRVVGTPPASLIVRKVEGVQVEISGPRPEVEPIGDGDVKVRVDLGSAHLGSQQLKILDCKAPTDDPAVVVRPLRRYVSAEVLPREHRRMMVEPVFRSEAPVGQTYGPTRLDPDWADVSGTHDDLQRVAKLRVYIQNHGGSIREDVPIRPVDRQEVEVTGVQVDPTNTHVEMNLVAAPATRDLVISVPTRGEVAKGYVVESITVDPVQVTVAGRGGELEQMTHVATVPVSLDGLAANTVRDVPLDVPNGVAVAEGQKVARVSITVKPMQQTAP